MLFIKNRITNDSYSRSKYLRAEIMWQLNITVLNGLLFSTPTLPRISFERMIVSWHPRFDRCPKPGPVFPSLEILICYVSDAGDGYKVETIKRQIDSCSCRLQHQLVCSR
jgi:hypothetical protein